MFFETAKSNFAVSLTLQSFDDTAELELIFFSWPVVAFKGIVQVNKRQVYSRQPVSKYLRRITTLELKLQVFKGTVGNNHMTLSLYDYSIFLHIFSTGSN